MIIRGTFRTLASGAFLAWLTSLALAAYLVARNPWFLDSAPWFAGFFFGLAALIGALLSPVLLVIPSFRRFISRDGGGRVLARGAALLLLAGSGLYFYSSRQFPKVEGREPKVLIIGLDGATWDIIDPLRDAGELPNLDALIRDGASGILHSMEPTISPALWTTMATGMAPAKHGIANFSSTQAQLRAKRFWDVAHLAGRSIGIMNWLVTWPPLQEDGGFLVPSHMERGPETLPPEMEFLQRLVGASRNDENVGPLSRFSWGFEGLVRGLRLSTAVAALREFVYEATENPDYLAKNHRQQEVALAMYCDLFLALRGEYRPQVSAVVFYGTDTLAHRYWRYFEPEAFPDTEPADVEKYREVIPDYYRAADEKIGELLRSVDENTTVLVVSDHGTQALGHGEVLRMPRLSGESLLEALGASGFVDATSVGNETFLSRKPGLHEKDFDLRDLASRLERARVGGTSAAPFVVLLNDEEGEAGDYVGVSFNLAVAEENPQAQSSMLDIPGGSTIAFDKLVRADFDISGGHHTRGIVILHGRGVRSGQKIENAALADVAPTVLHLVGLPVGEDMDGSVLLEAMEPAFAARHPIKSVPSYGAPENVSGDGPSEMSEELKRQLKSLGYIN